jgi:hypothetical protein
MRQTIQILNTCKDGIAAARRLSFHSSPKPTSLLAKCSSQQQKASRAFQATQAGFDELLVTGPFFNGSTAVTKPGPFFTWLSACCFALAASSRS